MNELELNKLSSKCDVRKLNETDLESIYTFCKSNTQYYEYCGKDLSMELIENDLTIAPPGIPMEQKYYIGFFEGDRLIAIMDLVVGFPDEDTAYIGFFMMNSKLQGVGIGSEIVAESLRYLRGKGFQKCRLGIDKGNPQASHFWKKNGFEVIRKVVQEEGIILVAERQL